MDANDHPCSRNTEKNTGAALRLDSECTQGIIGVGADIASETTSGGTLPMPVTRRKSRGEARSEIPEGAPRQQESGSNKRFVVRVRGGGKRQPG